MTSIKSQENSCDWLIDDWNDIAKSTEQLIIEMNDQKLNDNDPVENSTIECNSSTTNLEIIKNDSSSHIFPSKIDDNNDEINELKKSIQGLRDEICNLKSENSKLSVELKSIKDNLRKENFKPSLEWKSIKVDPLISSAGETLLENENQSNRYILDIHEANYEFVFDKMTELVNIDDKIRSASFSIQNTSFYLIVQSKAINNKRRIGLYLRASASTSNLEGLHIVFRLINQLKPKETIQKIIECNVACTKWGIANLLSAADYSNPDKGFIKDGQIKAGVYIRGISKKQL